MNDWSSSFHYFVPYPNAPSTRLHSDKYQFLSHWFDSTRVRTVRSESPISQNGRWRCAHSAILSVLWLGMSETYGGAATYVPDFLRGGEGADSPNKFIVGGGLTLKKCYSFCYLIMVYYIQRSVFLLISI